MIIICYFILVAFGMQFTRKKAIRLYALLSALLLAYISYHVVVPESVDLVRHFQEIDSYRIYGWRWIILANRVRQNIGTQIMYFLASFLPNNYWFTAIIIFISYWLLYDLMIMVYLDNNLSKKWLSSAVLFVGLSFNFYLLIFAMRIWVAFIVFSYCAYIELIRKKHRLVCWLVYVFLILFHYVSTILIALRMITVFLQKDSGKTAILKKTCVVLLSVAGFYIIMRSPVGELMIQKYESYDSYSVRGTWQTISCWGRSIGIILMAISQMRRDRRGTTQFYYIFLLGVLAVMVCMVQNYQITLRFTDCLVVSSIPILPSIFNDRSRTAFCVTYPQLFAWIVIIISVAYTIMFDYRLLTFAF